MPKFRTPFFSGHSLLLSTIELNDNCYVFLTLKITSTSSNATACPKKLLWIWSRDHFLNIYAY